MKNNNQVRNLFLLLLLSCCWGPSFLFIKIAIEYVGPMTMTATRLFIGGILLFIILKIQKTELPKFGKEWKHFAVMAIFSCGLPFTMFAVGEKYIDSSLASIINGSTPLFTLMIAHFVTQDDRMTKTKLLGSIIGFSGILLLVLPSLFDAKGTLFGIFAALTAALSYGIGFVYAKKNIHGFKPLVVPTAQLIIATLFLAPLALIFEKPYEIEYISNAAILAILGLAVFGSATAFVVYYKLIASTNATYTASANYIIPVFGVILGMVVLDEALTWNSYVGSMLILFGVMIANGFIRFSKA